MARGTHIGAHRRLILLDQGASWSIASTPVVIGPTVYVPAGRVNQHEVNGTQLPYKFLPIYRR